MRTFAEKPKTTQPTTSAKSSAVSRAHVGQHHDPNSILNLQRTMGNQALLRFLQSNGEERNTILASTVSLQFGHDFARIPVNPHKADALQTKLSVNKPGDEYEQEADRIAEQVMCMPDPELSIAPAPAQLSRKCAACEEEEPRKLRARPAGASVAGGSEVPSIVYESLCSIGQALDPSTRAFMEPRFGQNFADVRVHTDPTAAESARAIGALAYASGNHIVFAPGQYDPGSDHGRQLLAHELAHIVQQDTRGAGPVPLMRQPFPGTGMVPPGDCSWADYIILGGSVETAKAVVNMMGACRAGDSCLFLAMKIAAITAEIAARVARDTTCFRGGDSGHREQVQGRVNMMSRCYEFFTRSNCSPDLITAMAVVVERAREVIAVAAAAVAVAVAVAAIVALIAALIALAEVIAAAAAAAAEAVLVGAAAAAVIALLVGLKNQLEGGEPSGA
jgi:hypothetical protein